MIRDVVNKLYLLVSPQYTRDYRGVEAPVRGLSSWSHDLSWLVMLPGEYFPLTAFEHSKNLIKSFVQFANNIPNITKKSIE